MPPQFRLRSSQGLAAPTWKRHGRQATELKQDCRQLSRPPTLHHTNPPSCTPCLPTLTGFHPTPAVPTFQHTGSPISTPCRLSTCSITLQALIRLPSCPNGQPLEFHPPCIHLPPTFHRTGSPSSTPCRLSTSGTREGPLINPYSAQSAPLQPPPTNLPPTFHHTGSPSSTPCRLSTSGIRQPMAASMAQRACTSSASRFLQVWGWGSQYIESSHKPCGCVNASAPQAKRGEVHKCGGVDATDATGCQAGTSKASGWCLAMVQFPFPQHITRAGRIIPCVCLRSFPATIQPVPFRWDAPGHAVHQTSPAALHCSFLRNPRPCHRSLRSPGKRWRLL